MKSCQLVNPPPQNQEYIRTWFKITGELEDHLCTVSSLTLGSTSHPTLFFALVFCHIKQATAAKYHERMEHERKAREDAAKSIVMGLGDGLDSFDSDVLASIADGIETVLKAPVSSEAE